MSVGVRSISLIYGTSSEVMKIIEVAEKEDIFSTLPERDEKNEKIRKKEFVNFLKILSKEDKVFLRALLNKSIEYFTLTVDKKCEKLLVDNFKDWKIVIDTNFIFNLLGLNNEYPEKVKRASRHLVDLLFKLKINIYVTQRTIDEFTSSVNVAEEYLKRYEISKKLLMIWSEHTENAIILAYCKAFKKYKVGVDDFLAQFKSLSITLQKYNINIMKDFQSSIPESKEFNDIAEEMRDTLLKETPIAEHDAFHFVLINKLRGSQSSNNFLDYKYWFLTLDGLMEKFGKKKNIIPFCIFPYQLRQLIMPLIPKVEDFEIAFFDYVIKHNVINEQTISNEDISDILGRVNYYEKEIGADNSYVLANKILMNNHFVSEFKKISNKDNKKRNGYIDEEIKKEVKQFIPKDREHKEETKVGKKHKKETLKRVIFLVLLMIHIFINIYLILKDRAVFSYGYFLTNAILFLCYAVPTLGSKIVKKNVVDITKLIPYCIKIFGGNKKEE